MISAIVVAAGKSSRMGDVDKLNLPFGNSTIFGTVIKSLHESKVDEIIVVSSKDVKLKPELASEKICFIINPDPGQGLTSSIQAGVQQANPENALIVCLADMPLLEKSHYNLLINNYLPLNGQAIVQPYMQEKPGNPVMFSPHFRDELMKLEFAHGCKPVVKANKDNLVKLESTDQAFFTDIDTREQYEFLFEL